MQFGQPTRVWVSPWNVQVFFFFRTILSEQELQQQQQHQLHSYSDKKLLTVPVNRDSAVSTCCCGNPNISGLMEELTSQHIEFHEIHWKQQKGMVWARLLKYQSLRSAQTYLDSSDLPFLTANLSILFQCKMLFTFNQCSYAGKVSGSVQPSKRYCSKKESTILTESISTLLTWGLVHGPYVYVNVDSLSSFS